MTTYAHHRGSAVVLTELYSDLPNGSFIRAKYCFQRSSDHTTHQNTNIANLPHGASNKEPKLEKPQPSSYTYMPRRFKIKNTRFCQSIPIMKVNRRGMQVYGVSRGFSSLGSLFDANWRLHAGDFRYMSACARSGHRFKQVKTKSPKQNRWTNHHIVPLTQLPHLNDKRMLPDHVCP